MKRLLPQPHTLVLALAVVLLSPLGLAACDDGHGGNDEPLGTCGLPLGECPDAGGADAVGDTANDVAEPEPGGEAWIVDGEWLEARLDDPAVQVLDVRPEADWEASRIPGALHLDPGALRATVDGVPGQVADSEAVAAAFGDAGLEAGLTTVVVASTVNTDAARVVWTLAYHGEDSRLLDGGQAGWDMGGRPTLSAAPPAAAGDWLATPPDDALRVTGQWVLDHLDDPGVVLVDARSSAEFSAGHIPGALSVDWHRNVDGVALRPEAEVAALYEDVPLDATVVAYCATGSRASVAWVVLRWLGYEDVRLYDGSWSEWSQLPGAPVE